jgi:hypothetical protein
VNEKKKSLFDIDLAANGIVEPERFVHVTAFAETLTNAMAWVLDVVECEGVIEPLIEIRPQDCECDNCEHLPQFAVTVRGNTE